MKTNFDTATLAENYSFNIDELDKTIAASEEKIATIKKNIAYYKLQRASFNQKLEELPRNSLGNIITNDNQIQTVIEQDAYGADSTICPLCHLSPVDTDSCGDELTFCQLCGND